jgi:hypothetical protein
MVRVIDTYEINVCVYNYCTTSKYFGVLAGSRTKDWKDCDCSIDGCPDSIHEIVDSRKVRAMLHFATITCMFSPTNFSLRELLEPRVKG